MIEQGNKEIVDETQRNELNKDAEWSLRFAKRVWPSRLRQNGQVTGATVPYLSHNV